MFIIMNTVVYLNQLLPRLGLFVRPPPSRAGPDLFVWVGPVLTYWKGGGGVAEFPLGKVEKIVTQKRV